MSINDFVNSIKSGLLIKNGVITKVIGNPKKVVIPKGITEIGDFAFFYCLSLTEVVIPGTVKRIGKNAFEGVYNLASVKISNGVEKIDDYAFFYCPSLSSIQIPGSVNKIGRNAFYGCPSLKSVTIAEGVKEIGDYAFSNCPALKSVHIPNSVNKIGEESFDDTVKIIYLPQDLAEDTTLQK